ncbi:ninja-family protein mc410 isoform X2 [Momordica charantia]|uniref:Ninja-family protein n=1 Tax=Momordica charantia TaxID=3673 RepID=A0A6J1DYL7_MOMCH|nr:ninja-family protein mc410 isoform X2 [Momordica charantia]
MRMGLSLAWVCPSVERPSSLKRQESDTGSFQSNSIPSNDNFFNDLSKSGIDGDPSTDLKRKGTWIESSNQYAEAEDENLAEIGNKRKLLFVEMNSQKKQERESHIVDLHEKARASHISSTEDGSTAEKGDVVESGVEGPTSRAASKHDDGSKQCIGDTSLPKVSKEVYGFSDSGAVDLSRQKRFNSSPAGAPNSVQTMNMNNLPFSLSVKDANTFDTPSTSGHLQLGIQHMLPTANGDCSGAERVHPRNLPLMGGVSPLHISATDKDKAWGLVSHPQIIHHPYVGGGSSTNSAAVQAIGHFTSEGLLYAGQATEHAKGDSRHPAMEEGSSSRAEHVKGSSINNNAKDVLERSKAAGVSLDFPAIKPGIAAEIEFGGCGSYPNLPWVSTTGPSGKTISGVTYRFNANQIKIVCACHGIHMSPEEFIRHASSENFNAQNDNAPGTIPNKSSAASAQS